MLNIFEFFQNLIDFFTGMLQAGMDFFLGFINWFGLMASGLNTIKGMVPEFMGSFVVIVLFFAGGALIIKLLPFVG